MGWPSIRCLPPCIACWRHGHQIHPWHKGPGSRWWCRLVTARGSQAMDIVITGANGAVGTALIRYLSAAAPLSTMRLRALVRRPARAQSLHVLGAEMIIVDYRRAETLRNAVAGAEVVVHL